MIDTRKYVDTRKYEGHAEGDWDWDDIDTLMDTHGTPIAEMTEGWNTKEATAQLIADAPLLLEEVKRLRDFIQSVWDGLGEAGRNEHYELFKEYMGDD
tara:strand:- start:503 stop:796 length:294 start_codon:yes stop_codon:yes gene_type:complete